MKKRKPLLLVGITFALALGCLNLTAKSECTKNLINESNQLVLEAIEIYKNRYLPLQLGSDVLASGQKRVYKLEWRDDTRTPNEYCFDSTIFEHWRISIKNIYDDLGSEEKYALEGISKASNEAKKEAENKPDVAEDATPPNKMQEQVEKGQAPKEVLRVDKAHDSFGQPHVHFKDGTALNRDGTIHDKMHGRPKPTRKTWGWLHRNGWSRNGIK